MLVYDWIIPPPILSSRGQLLFAVLTENSSNISSKLTAINFIFPAVAILDSVTPPLGADARATGRAARAVELPVPANTACKIH